MLPLVVTEERRKELDKIADLWAFAARWTGLEAGAVDWLDETSRITRRLHVPTSLPLWQCDFEHLLRWNCRVDVSFST